ncbi:formate--tetrahydrofolate ligase [Solemya velesiana gill symbiont]|uniref:Formate--tetrahydrofolate ligase n=1 Tax=Solemya velesiana gill symbiont TaxID=1918948 RepID=A0A1T2KV24_9GAMM|nr:formate--tetrahydrofolate ligase [Solemya velesiana gill symbiont]OOZ36709.1 formate--tetrahydrofolate ligase [Solemya velesiana gill symbiont]
MRPILEIAKMLQLDADDLFVYGDQMAKVRLDALPDKHETSSGKIVLVSAINPTRAGEGKTTVSIGLAQGLKRIGKHAALALREPSLGPIFGMKGGGTGGGQCQLEPSTRINMHFTGDIHAVGAAHNLLAALLDNAVHFHSGLDLEHRQVFWRRVLDINDRALRQVVIGLGGRTNGVPREASFDITAASEVMAILCLAEDLSDLKARLGRILVGFDRAGDPVTADKLQAAGSMAALLQDAILPNLVQSTEGVPAFVHGGPFGNIAHGCNSVIATRTAAAKADFVVAEAGFGFDLGAEKFFDIKCRSSELWPNAVVLVVTVRALRIHGCAESESRGNPDEIKRGMLHLDHHVKSVRAFGFEPVIAINCFAEDSEADLALIESACAERGLRVARTTAYTEGGAGAEQLADVVAKASNDPQPEARYLYDLEQSPEEKIESVARTIYGSGGVSFSRQARKELERIRCLGYDKLPICIAKTHLSLSTDPDGFCQPEGFELPVESIRVAAGAGYLLALTGDIVTMPGLPKEPAAIGIDLNDVGEISGV